MSPPSVMPRCWSLPLLLLLATGPPGGSASTTGASTCASFPFNPWLLNAVVLGDVGSATTSYANTDIGGAAAILGHGYFNNVTFNSVHTQSPTDIALYVGGGLVYTNGHAAGGMEVAGGAAFTSDVIGTSGVDGPVSIGGSLSGGTGTTITGDLLVAGSCQWCSTAGNVVASGFTTTIGGTFSPTLDLNCLQSYFQAISTSLNLPGTVTYTNTLGTITITLPAGTTRSYVTIPAIALRLGHTININGNSADQELIINVPATAIHLANSLQFNYNTIPGGNVLLHLPNCVTLTLGGSYNVNLLAPLAATTTSTATTVAPFSLTGNLIVQSLQPGASVAMQINDGLYTTIQLPLSCPNGVCSSTSETINGVLSAPVRTPSPSLSPSSSPTASRSSVPSPSPPASPSSLTDTSPHPAASAADCASSTTQFMSQYSYFDPGACDALFIQTVQQTYNCAPITPGCGAYYCTVAIPPAVAAALGQCSMP